MAKSYLGRGNWKKRNLKKERTGELYRELVVQLSAFVTVSNIGTYCTTDL